MKYKTRTIPILLIALFLVVSIGLVGYTGSAEVMDEDVEFELEDWDLSQELVQPGEELEIEGYVTNQDDEEGTDVAVVLYIDGDEVKTQDPFVGPEQSELVNFTHSEEEEGTYTVEVELRGYDERWDGGEFRVELVTRVEIEPEVDRTITAGQNIDFSAEAYSGEDDDEPETDDSIFTWENTDDTGFFDITEAGEYEVSATYNDVSSETINVTVEPADPEVLVFIETPEENEIIEGEKAEYTVQVQDAYGNVQPDGEFNIALDVDGERRHSTFIHDGEAEATLDWSTTSDRQGEFTIEVIGSDTAGGQLTPDEIILTVNEEDEDMFHNILFWVILVAFIMMVPLTIFYAWKAVDQNFGKVKPQSHEWKREKEDDETSDQ